MPGQLLKGLFLYSCASLHPNNHELFMNLREQTPIAIDPNETDRLAEIDRLAYEQVLAQARSNAGAAALRRLEEGFHEYYRDGGEDQLYLPGLQCHAWWDAHEILDARRLERNYP